MLWTKGKTTLIVAGGFVFLLVIALLLRRTSETRCVRLSDGSRVRVCQVSFGKKHPLPDNSIWQRIVAAMPTNITAPLGIRPRTRRTLADTLLVWFQWELGTNYVPYPQWLRVIDSNGLASASTYVGHTLQRSNTAFLQFEIMSFPRDQASLLLELQTFGPRSRFGRQIWR